MIVVSAAKWQSFRDGDNGGLSEMDMFRNISAAEMIIWLTH